MAGEVRDCVLPFAERVVRRRIQHTSPMLEGARLMTIDVIHAHHHGMTIFAGRTASLSYDDGAIANVHLRAMIRDSQPQLEPERIAEPVNRGADVRIAENRNYRTRRYRPILKHGALH